MVRDSGPTGPGTIWYGSSGDNSYTEIVMGYLFS